MNADVASQSHAQRILSADTDQYSTFLVSGRLYGIDVVKVQEVVKPMSMTKVPLAPEFVKGLINLRGQVATAIGLRELFQLDAGNDEELMNVVCRQNGSLVAFLVDGIGDVVEVPRANFESTPPTIPQAVRKYMRGVYKEKDALLSILDLQSILRFINTKK